MPGYILFLLKEWDRWQYGYYFLFFNFSYNEDWVLHPDLVKRLSEVEKSIEVESVPQTPAEALIKMSFTLLPLLRERESIIFTIFANSSYSITLSRCQVLNWWMRWLAIRTHEPSVFNFILMKIIPECFALVKLNENSTCQSDLRLKREDS